MGNIDMILLRALLEIAGTASSINPQSAQHSCLDAIAITFVVTLLGIGMLISLGLWVEKKASPTYNDRGFRN